MPYFPAEIPFEATRQLIAAVRAGHPASTETVDAALYTLGCLNALRGSAVPFFAIPATPAVKEMQDSELDTLAVHIETLLPGRPPTESTVESMKRPVTQAAIPSLLIPILFELAARVLSRFIARGVPAETQNPNDR